MEKLRKKESPQAERGNSSDELTRQASVAIVLSDKPGIMKYIREYLIYSQEIIRRQREELEQERRRERFGKILNELDCGVLIFSKQNREIVYSNGTAQKLLKKDTAS
ncbi:MAG TPA: hypothetical protein ENN41_09355 [Sediminispirochaeta sp.]|nr:hypothetical protein [Sediminispirochaeta sp.]